MTEIEHIIWREPPHDLKYFEGLFEVEIYYHGDDGTTVAIVTGTYYDRDFQPDMYRTIRTEFGTITSNSLGISGIQLRRIGEFPDRNKATNRK
jgi:hypothetical protein